MSRRQQLRQRVETARERIASRSTRHRAADGQVVGGQPPMPFDDRPTIRSLVPGVVFGAAVAVIGLAGLWGWQTWSNRVSAPIDDRLPLLLATEQPEGLGVEESPVVSDAASTSGSDAPVSAAAAEQATTQTPPAAVTRIVVHVSGAVAFPGVVELAEGARVIDALRAAGDATALADLERVNLAAIVLDGERLHVPTQGEDRVPVVVAPARSAGPIGDGAATAETDAPLIDINDASAEALEGLPGIGPATAQAIVRTRLDRGPFLTVEELLDVPGIGESKLAQIAPFVTAAS